MNDIDVVYTLEKCRETIIDLRNEIQQLQNEFVTAARNHTAQITELENEIARLKGEKKRYKYSISSTDSWGRPTPTITRYKLLDVIKVVIQKFNKDLSVTVKRQPREIA